MEPIAKVQPAATQGDFASVIRGAHPSSSKGNKT